MSKDNVVNIAASVLARLKHLASKHGQSYQNLLLRYATERFLYRLSISEYANAFVLKGGNLFVIWQDGNNSRPTMDSDLLCFEFIAQSLNTAFDDSAPTDSALLDQEYRQKRQTVQEDLAFS